MNILSVNSANTLLKSFNISSLKKLQINGTSKKNVTISLKELHVINEGKHLARENLDTTHNSSINKKLQETLESKLCNLNEIKKRMAKNNDMKNKELEDGKIDNHIDKSIKVIEKTRRKEETKLDEDENLLDKKPFTLEDVNKKISETHMKLKDSIKLDKEFHKQSKIIDEKISMYKKRYGNDIFKIAEKEVILKKVYDTSNNPLIKELNSTFNEILELESKLKDSLSPDKK